jgi:hypothetical protein
MSVARSLFTINIGSIVGIDSSLSVGADLYFYASDGVTSATTYTTPDGSVENANPMPTQGDGRFLQQAWLEPGTYVYALVPPGGSVADPWFTGKFVAPTQPTITDALDDFLAGDAPLPIENGGTNATDAATALANLGGLPEAGGTVTGNIIRSTKGVHTYWDTATMNHGGMFLTVSSDPDPTANAGEVWFKYT